jgi:Uma2 family endonuclease
MIAKPEVVEHVLLYDVSWEAYERLLEVLGNRRFRHTYIGGVLEIMSPHFQHEWLKKALARIIETVTLQLGIPLRCAGSTTLKSALSSRGLEPDECYYIQNASRMDMQRNLDLSQDPPPDLAIEVNLSYQDLSRNEVYASLKVPELWHYDVEDDKLQLLSLHRSKYIPVPKSVALPMLSQRQIKAFLKQARESQSDDNQLVRYVIEWSNKNKP